MKTLFNDGWLFAKTEADHSKENDWSGEYAPIQLPHDWLIHNTCALYETGFGRYKKKYDFGKVEGKSFRLYFEGVYMNSTVFVNEKPAFDWKYGYSTFEADITEYLQDGENEIEVLVRHEAPNTRWYSGAGIFRDVYLIETEKSYLATDGTYFHTDKTDNGFDISISAEVIKPEGLTVSFILKGDETLHSEEISATALTEINFSLNEVAEKHIWDIQHPNLLTLEIALKRNDEIIDFISQKVGLRDCRFDTDTGFYLNGRHVKLNGVCLHHDLGCLGAAFNKSAARRQLLKMMEMGANSVRTSHNPPAKGFMELCDELGILVNSEMYDMWERPKTEFDNARFFKDWYRRDIASWIRRDRNHPSVIMWSVGNEIYDTHVSPRGCEVAKMLHEAVRENDYKKNAPTTIGSNYMPWEGAQNCAKQVDLAGYNYLERLYEEHHKTYPDWKIYGSETTSGVKSRGVYHFPKSAAFLTHDDLQCSALGNCKAGASAETAQNVIAMNRDIDVCAGMYIWTGADYIGEPSPYSTKNAYFGNIDTAGIEKDSFWLYKAAWTDRPVLHLLPYWDFNDGQIIDVVVYTNLDKVELFVNNKSYGKKTTQEYTLDWQIYYEKGEIRVVGYDKNGRKHQFVRRSFGNSKKIVLTPYSKEVKADGEDMAFVLVSTVDENGNPVENARDRINLTVEGGRLVGFDNGDSTDYDQYKSSSRRLFSGKAVAYIMADTEEGDIIVTAKGEGLEAATTVIKAVKSEVRKGISTFENICEESDNKEIPIRKIELTRTEGAALTPMDSQSIITARVLPENATYRDDIKYSIVTDSGIESNIAVIEDVDGQKVLKALGDGGFRLRVSSNNGRNQVEILSEFEFCATGFGQLSMNPYEFIRCCHYNDSISLMDEVRDGGINIKRDNNIIGFTKTDFGKYGTDSFFVRMINWHSDAPFNFRMWLGYPEREGSQLIGEFTYQADFEWQTYKDNSYTLPCRICGMQDLYFEFDKNDFRIDFGGFEFAKNEKAYERINAVDNDLLHGDTFEIVGNAVTGIGNNVFMDFNDMNFTKGTKKFILKGRTRHDNDSVHVHFATEEGIVAQEIIEFPYSEDYIEVEHMLPDIRGNATVKVIFLPGCDFDFDSFIIEGEDE